MHEFLKENIEKEIFKYMAWMLINRFNFCRSTIYEIKENIDNRNIKKKFWGSIISS